MKYSRLLFVLLSWVMFNASSVTPVRGQDGGLAFLRIGTDAASLALGDAGVAVRSGAFATYWNPAALAEGDRNELALSHHIWIADVRTYVAAGRFNLGAHSGLGLQITATGSGDLEARQRPGRPDGLFDAQFINAGIAYGRSVGFLSFGAGVKYLSERIFTDSANGYALDFAVQFADLGNGIRAGLAIQNIGKMDKLSAQATRLPRLFRAGVQVFPFRILADIDGTRLLNTSLLLELSRNAVTETTQVHIGVAAEVLDTVTARAGYISNDDLRSYSAGIGVAMSGFSFDYALLPFEDGFGGPAHILTLVYDY